MLAIAADWNSPSFQESGDEKMTVGCWLVLWAVPPSLSPPLIDKWWLYWDWTWQLEEFFLFQFQSEWMNSKLIWYSQYDWYWFVSNEFIGFELNWMKLKSNSIGLKRRNWWINDMKWQVAVNERSWVELMKIFWNFEIAMFLGRVIS